MGVFVLMVNYSSEYKRLFEKQTFSSLSLQIHVANPFPATHRYTQSCIYKDLNTCLRQADRSHLKPYFPYLNLLLTALLKLPTVGLKVVYRGIKGVDLRSSHSIGSLVTWYNFSSCTLDGDVLHSPSFLGPTGPRTLFTITCRSGRDIALYSSYKSEKEVLLMAGTCLRVENSMAVPGSNGLVIINLRETDLPAGVKLIS